MQNNNEELKFNLIKEEGKELDNLIIEERGYVNKFTWAELREVMKQNVKSKNQLEAQIEIDQAAIKNIEEKHAFVKDFTPIQRHAISLYDSYLKNVKQCQEKLEEFLTAEIADNDRKAQIIAQIPELEIYANN